VPEVRRRFSENLAQIEFSGDSDKVSAALEGSYQIISNKPVGNYQTLLVKMPPETDINQLLRLLIDQCHIHSCQEVLPSMNDVFINVVNQNKTIS
jgi:ABC-2 type transport system ATP-binding protein